jgi:hypothetical protein
MPEAISVRCSIKKAEPVAVPPVEYDVGKHLACKRSMPFPSGAPRAQRHRSNLNNAGSTNNEPDGI